MLAWRGDFEYRLRVLDTIFDLKHMDLAYPAEVADYLKAAREGKALPNAEEIVERHIFNPAARNFRPAAHAESERAPDLCGA